MKWGKRLQKAFVPQPWTMQSSNFRGRCDMACLLSVDVVMQTRNASNVQCLRYGDLATTYDVGQWDQRIGYSTWWYHGNHRTMVYILINIWLGLVQDWRTPQWMPPMIPITGKRMINPYQPWDFSVAYFETTAKKLIRCEGSHYRPKQSNLARCLGVVGWL